MMSFLKCLTLLDRVPSGKFNRAGGRPEDPLAHDPMDWESREERRVKHLRFF
jgi:hypothetical protein